MTKIRTVSQSNAIGQSKLNYSNTRLDFSDFLPVNLIFFSQAGRDHYVYWLRNTKPGITADYRRRSFDILIVMEERFSSASPFFRFCWGYFHNILNSVTKKWMFLLTWRAFGLVSIDHLHFSFHPSFLSLITRLANGKISVSLWSSSCQTVSDSNKAIIARGTVLDKAACRQTIWCLFKRVKDREKNKEKYWNNSPIFPRFSGERNTKRACRSRVGPSPIVRVSRALARFLRMKNA